jgi:histidinol dehydrogenase
MLQPQRLSFKDVDFWDRLKQLLAWESTAEETIFQKVKEILHDVRTNGDAAVLKYTNRFDRRDVQHIDQIKLSQDDLKNAWEKLPLDQQTALKQARDRIVTYHERQKQNSWQYQELDGTILGQKITPLDRVGLYVPGGKAAYPSSVLMNALPAKVAGVSEIIMVVPAPDGVLNDMVLAAAYLSEVNQVFTIGGAQAVAALAYGTQSIPAVDKIVGPGNIYVATAKSLVFGTVGIDMIAGPSEILVICDGKTNPDWIAMDLFSQAEHDELAQPILIAQDSVFLDQVQLSMNKLIETMPRKDIISISIQNRSAFVLVENLEQAAEVSNYIAPEHLELSIDNPETLLPLIRHAGAIFLGRFTAEALGDYCAGPNHVLPTSRSARFSSPLGVYDFQKRSSIIHCSENGASDLGKIASILAHGEGLTAHARSAEYRIK